MNPITPYRGRFGDPRPDNIAALALPPQSMPSHIGLRPLKAWRYIGVFTPELMLCVASVRIGRARQAFWAVWDRKNQRLYERTTLGRGRVEMTKTGVRVAEPNVRLVIDFAESGGIETVCPTGDAYAWTRKQVVTAARVWIDLDRATHRFLSRAIIDDTAAYYERHTAWRWSAGIGTSRDSRPVAWNLVEGVNDPPHNSERTIWIDDVPQEAPPCNFASDLTRVDELRFHAEATRERNENLLLIRSSYRQPFGSFEGRLPGGPELQSGFGVMEHHDVRW
jgi:Domain of unknown function (DUF2804), C-terminal